MAEGMHGKTVVITGGTNGIGLVTARELARMGAQVVIVSRNEDKCAKTVEQIRKDTGNTNVEFIAEDLSVMANIRQAAYEFKKRHTRLDILINNAGAIFFKRQVSADGFEMTFALNHLSYFLFTHLLLETLKTSAPSRIITVASHAHEGARLNFDDLLSEKKYNGYGAYGSSKLANIMFTYELAEKLAGTRVTANALHPGFVATGFARNNGGIINFGMGLTHLFARTPKKGAETSIYLASSPEVESVSGKYFTDCKAVESDPVSYDKAAQEKLWEASLEMIVSR